MLFEIIGFTAMAATKVKDATVNCKSTVVDKYNEVKDMSVLLDVVVVGKKTGADNAAIEKVVMHTVQHLAAQGNSVAIKQLAKMEAKANAAAAKAAKEDAIKALFLAVK